MFFKTLPSLTELKKYRFDKFSRFDNSTYWKNYYSIKLKKNDVKREQKYAKIILNYTHKDAKVAEMACGVGFLSKEMNDVGLTVTAIDLFDEMLSQAKKYLKNTNVKLIKGDIAKTGLKEKSFDAVTAMSVIEHVSQNEVIENIIPEFKRILKDDGYLFIHVPVKSIYSQLVKFLRKYVYKDLPEWAIDDDGDITHRFWISYDKYIKMFQDQGFELINYDFYLTRSHLKPKALSSITKKIQEMTEFTDTHFDKTIKKESIQIKLAKIIKSKFALTSYFLLRKK